MAPVILVADDHIMICKALRRLFEIDFGYRDVLSVPSCNGLLNALKKGHYTHLILDLGLADGCAMEILPNIRRLYPPLKIMVYSANPAGVYRRGLQRFKVYHYLSKGTDEVGTSQGFRNFFYDQAKEKPKVLPDGSPFSLLTDRQLQVMHYVLNGRSGVETAEALNIKANTVSTLKGQVFERTGTKNVMELAALAGLYKIT